MMKNALKKIIKHAFGVSSILGLHRIGREEPRIKTDGWNH